MRGLPWHAVRGGAWGAPDQLLVLGELSQELSQIDVSVEDGRNNRESNKTGVTKMGTDGSIFGEKGNLNMVS